MSQPTLEIKKTRFLFAKENIPVLEIMRKTGQPYFMRQTGQQTSVVINGVEMIYPSTKSAFRPDALFLFKSVRNDALKFLDANPDWKLPIKMPVNCFNYDYNNSLGVLTGTDINHAYWSIARNLGIISEKTYLSGLREKFKIYNTRNYLLDKTDDLDNAKKLIETYSGTNYETAITEGWRLETLQFKDTRLASLSVLGAKRTYKQYVGHEVVGEVVVREANERLKDCYKSIRYTCYQYMKDISELLGKNDFESWQTDCIYYRDSEKNRKIVYDYLNEKKMRYKQLVYD